MRKHGPVIACLLAGCFSELPGGDGPDETDLVTITGTYSEIDVSNDSEYRPRATIVPRDSRGVTAQVDSGLRPMTHDGGAFSFRIPPGDPRYRVMIDDDGVWPHRQVEIQHAARALSLVVTAAKRPGCEQYPSSPGPFIIETAGDAETGQHDYALATTGIWTDQRLFPEPEPAPSSTIGGWYECPLSRARRDRVYYLRMPTGEPGGIRIDGVLAADVDTIDGAATEISGSMVPLEPNRCSILTGDRAAEAARFDGVLASARYTAPADVEGAPLDPTGDWVLYATPSRTLAPTRLIQLAAAANPRAPAQPPANFRTAAVFANPLPGGDVVAMMRVQRERTFTLPGMPPSFRMPADLVIYQALDPDSGCTEADLTASIAIPDPASFVLDSAALTLDDVEVHVRGSQSSFTFELSPGDEPDWYEVTLYEIVKHAEVPSTSLSELRVIWTTTRNVRLPHELLLAGHRYALKVTAHRGLPRAKDGDFQTISYPVAAATAYSEMFRVR